MQNLINLNRGEPPYNPFIRQAMNRFLCQEEWQDAFHYCDRKGLASLRECYTALYGVQDNPEKVIITHGALGALELIMKGIREEYETIYVWDPCYREALKIFRFWCGNIKTIAKNENGRPIFEAIAREEKDLSRAIIYIIPSLNNPDGMTLTEEERETLVRFSCAHGMMVIEDDTYSDFIFTGRHYRSLLQIAHSLTSGEHKVIRLYSLAKRLFPGLRTCFLEGASGVIDRLAEVKYDFGASPVTSLMACHLLAESREQILAEYKGHLRSNCLTLCSGLQKAGIDMVAPEGGYFAWLRLPARICSTEFVANASLQGIELGDGKPFWLDQRETHIRISFSFETSERIAEGVKILANLLK